MQVIWNVDVPVETRVSRAREWIASDADKTGVEKVLHKLREPEVHVEFEEPMSKPQVEPIPEATKVSIPEATEYKPEATVESTEQHEDNLHTEEIAHDEKPVLDVEEAPKKKPAKKKVIKKKTFPKAPVMEL